MAAIRPIKPSEIVKQKRANFPPVVLEAFNGLIAQNYSGSSSVVYQKEIIEVLEKKGLSKADIFKNHWLDVEEMYRSAGWVVKYESPAYDENFDPHFRFSGK